MNKRDVPARPHLRATPSAASVAAQHRAAPMTAAQLDAARASRATPSAAASQQGRASARAGTAAEQGALDFERVYVEHFHHVSRWARALGGRAADLDDLAQDVFVVVRRKLDSFAGPSLPAWLYGITRKTVSDYRRRAWIKRLLGGAHQSLDTLSAVQQVSGVEAVERMEARRILQRVLDQMSSVRRSAFMLFEIEGYSGEEIAELEQVPLATVYTRLHHARKDFLRLTAAITGAEPGEPPP
jgi:RNA polymerase sigma-70 factor (ECF subfamily)